MTKPQWRAALSILAFSLCPLLAQDDSQPSIHIVFFSPSDLPAPEGVQHRLTKIADATENFLFKEMNLWGYPPAVKNLFHRAADGRVEVLSVRGEMPVSSGKYDKPDFAPYVIGRAAQQYHLTESHIWWIFVYLGERPVRFQNFMGYGDPRHGGFAMINYDSVPGEVRPDLALAEGFNRECFLKSTIHELGHAFGLHHVGPDTALGLGNSLMGPTPTVYSQSKSPNPEQVYLSESSAAELWKHPVFAGTQLGDRPLPKVALMDYKSVFNPADDSVIVSGRLTTDQQAHSVTLVDDRGHPDDQYWVRSYAVLIAPDGTFQFRIYKPARANGHYRILFCFDNGLVSGDGNHFRFEDRGDIEKAYTFRNGDFEFGH